MREPERLDPAYELEMARAELAEAEGALLRTVRFGPLTEGWDECLTPFQRRLLHYVARLDNRVRQLERMMDEEEDDEA